MNENNLQLQAFEFVEKIISKESKSTNQNFESWKGSSSHMGVVDLTDKFVDSPVIITQYMPDYSDYKKHIMINNMEYGFIDEEYKNFYKLVYEISEWNNIQSLVSIDYLKEKILYWIIDIYRNNVCSISLFTYIEDNLFKDIHQYKYCFPILNIDIEQNFNVGESTIKFFTKEYFDNLFESKNIKNKLSTEDFDKLFRKFQGQVFVEIAVFAESKKAELIAYENACFIVDILKLTCPTVQFPTEKCFLELESRMPFSYDFLIFKNHNIYDFSITTKINRSQMLPFNLKLVNDYKPIFNEFGKLLDPNCNTDIEKLVKNSIIFFSKCISEVDLHLRISKIIMIIESIFLLDDEKYKMENKCKRRFLDFAFELRDVEKTNFNKILTEMYQVRHKMTHKSIRIFIDNSKLRIFQIEVINLLFLLLKQNFNNKEALINQLDLKMNA